MLILLNYQLRIIIRSNWSLRITCLLYWACFSISSKDCSLFDLTFIWECNWFQMYLDSIFAGDDEQLRWISYNAARKRRCIKVKRNKRLFDFQIVKGFVLCILSIILLHLFVVGSPLQCSSIVSIYWKESRSFIRSFINRKLFRRVQLPLDCCHNRSSFRRCLFNSFYSKDWVDVQVRNWHRNNYIQRKI